MVNEKLKTELLKTEKTASFPFLIHIHNDDLGDFYYVNSDKDVVYEGKTYLSSFFEINPPDKTQERIGNASLKFSVVNTEWIEKIRNTQKRSTIEFIGVVIYENDTVEPIEVNSFTLTSAQWNESILTWEMVFDENMNILLPCVVMNGLNCAGCV